MYCRNCGEQINPNASVCVKCGFAKNTGNLYCPNCGEQTNPGAAVCVKCGFSLAEPESSELSDKSRIAAGLLGIFLGAFGIHNFYLGRTTRALVQLLVSIIGGIFTCGIASMAMGIWGLVEGILILTNKDAVDGNGLKLKD